MITILVDEISEYFAAAVDGFRRLSNLPSDCPAWTLITSEYYGVAIPNPRQKKINEQFSSVCIEEQSYRNGDLLDHYLVLLCTNRNLRREFAFICAQFVEPGEKNGTRNSLQSDPFIWWRTWRSLLGNRIAEKPAFAVIGEMLSVERQLKQGIRTYWGGPEAGTHDIDTPDKAIEVKSTTQKYRTTLTISSQNQLKSSKPLELYFLRFEECRMDGLTIDIMARRLTDLGYNAVALEGQLSSLGFGIGKEARSYEYRLLEKRIYRIDDGFPRIVPESFVGGQLPQSIVHIEYTVDLDGLPYERW